MAKHDYICLYKQQWIFFVIITLKIQTVVALELQDLKLPKMAPVVHYVNVKLSVLYKTYNYTCE